MEVNSSLDWIFSGPKDVPAGEEDAVDGGRGDAGLLEELVDGTFDGFEVRGDPRVELFAADGGANVDGAVAEVEVGFGLGGQQALGVLDRFVEAVAEIVVDQIVERLQLFGLFGLTGERAEEVERFVGLQERQVVPALQVRVEPDRDGEALFAGAEPGPVAEFGADDVADEAGIERVAECRSPRCSATTRSNSGRGTCCRI